MLLGGFLPWAWDTASALVQRAGWAPEQCEITVSIAFIALQFMAATLLGLPWEWYITFSIEQKHGFNKQTAGLFVADKVKEMALYALFGVPIIAGLLKLIRWGGDNFFLYVWAFASSMVILMK